MPEWQELFALSVSPWELIIRGTAVYWFLVLVFRFVCRRDVGSVGMADILLLVIIADAAQNAMAGDYRTITDGFILVSTIIGWNLAIDWLAFHSPRVRRVFEPKALPLVIEGRIQWRNLRRELISKEELLGKLREHEVADVKDVKAAYMESDGAISVIPNKPR